MSAPARERRPSHAQVPILARLVELGGVRVRRADMDVYAPVGSWVAVVAAGWALVDRGTEDNRGGDELEYRYTLTAAGWKVAGVDADELARTRLTLACLEGDRHHVCGGRIYGTGRTCVCGCHYRDDYQAATPAK